MESQVEMFKAMMGDVNFNPSTNEFKGEPFYCLGMEREDLVQQTLSKIKEANPKDIRKRLRVSFKGEEGLDAGGVSKEVSASIYSRPLSNYFLTVLTSKRQCIVFPTPQRRSIRCSLRTLVKEIWR